MANNQNEGLLHNDPSRRHDPFNLAFDKQFQEVDEEYESVRTIQKTCYHSTRKGCFNFWSLVIGILLSFIWGIIMGTMQFMLIWIVYPWVKIWKLYWIPGASVVGSILNAIFGECLKNVSSRGTTVNVNGNDIQQVDNNNNKDLIVGNGTPSGYPQV
mmetsp:Transcript_55129/g.49629  ORF Transcript_55129/g.49629 Transcript_55129/m.49629 type:complete len:157 (+) Transcript_55129:63-533(+)